MLAARAISHGVQDVFVGCQEHVMEADLEATTFGACSQHGAAVIGHDETDRLP
jgi:hypothetical protein